MPRRPDISQGVMDAILDLSMRLRAHPGAPFEVKQAWFKQTTDKLGPRAARLAQHLYDALADAGGIVLSTTVHAGMFNMTNTPNGQNVTQIAGGDMVGVNAGGTQTVGDITIYMTGLDAAAGSLTGPVRDALAATRRALDATVSDAEDRELLVSDLERLTAELKKGDAKSTKRVSALWAGLKGMADSLPAAAELGTAITELAKSLGIV